MTSDDGERSDESRDGRDFIGVAPSGDDYTDGRKPWDWKSRYPDDARRGINVEAACLVAYLVVSLMASSVCLSLGGRVVEFETSGLGLASGNALLLRVNFGFLSLFFVGWVGGTTFSIKWLIHTAARGMWHRDRRYWRLLTPFLGGVYACVVLTLFGGGLFGGGPSAVSYASPATTALAFLVGYFSDGVSGLLSNIANAVFGTLERK